MGPAGLLQPLHLVVVLVILALVLGPGRLRGMGRALGESARALVEGFREARRPAPEPPPPALPAQPCPHCGAWSVEMASYCTRWVTRLG